MQLTKLIKKKLIASPVIFHKEFDKIKSEYGNANLIYTDGYKCKVGVPFFVTIYFK